MRIEVQNACVRYGTRTVFEGVNATFSSSSVTALIGPSGSGKTTMLAAIAGYQRLTTGAIAYHASDGSVWPPDPGFVSWIPQGGNALPARTVLDNVAIGPLAAGFALEDAYARSISSLREVGIADLAENRAATLSGGELQRLCFARATAAGRALILADEPSSSLDRDSTRRLAETLAQLSTSSTVIVATHDTALITAAQDVVDLRDG